MAPASLWRRNQEVLKRRKVVKRKARAKAAFPLREPQGAGSALLPSSRYPHRPWAGQAGPGWQPSLSRGYPDSPSLGRKLFPSPFPALQGETLSHLLFDGVTAPTGEAALPGKGNRSECWGLVHSRDLNPRPRQVLDPLGYLESDDCSCSRG